MRSLTKATTGLGLIALLGAFGGCNLQSGGTPPQNPCPNPLFGPETPGYVCMDAGAMKDELLEQADHIPPEDIWHVGWTGVTVRNGVNSLGPTAGYVRLPGFPQHRFLVYLDYPEGISEFCSDGPVKDCYKRAAENGWRFPVYPVGVKTLIGPLRPFYPLLVGKDGSTEATMEWVTHYWGPKDLRPLRDPYEYQERMERDPDPQAYKAYTFSRTYRAVLAPGRNVRIEAGAFRAERAPQYDSRPLGRGYNTYTVGMAEYWRYPLQRNIWPTPPSPEEKDRLYRMQFYWENTPYYAFQEGSGIITPPMPICQPGLGYRVNVVAGYAQFRNLLFPYDRYPLETYDRASPVFPGSVVPYTVHMVQLVGRENPEVINYDHFVQATGFGANPFRNWTVEFRPEGYPGYEHGTPSDLARYPLWGVNPPGRTFRVAVLYRFTLGHPDPQEWKPSPSHPPGEDNWYIVWSDVRIAGTRDNPQCSVEAIGYHSYDEVTSRELDAYFGLRDMPLPSGDLRGYFYTTLPSLSRLNPRDDVGYLLVPVGSVTLPSWAFPPGW